MVLRRRSWQCCRQITQVHRLPALLSCRHCSAAVQSGHRACEFNGCKTIPVFGRQPGVPCAAFLCRMSTSTSSTSREFDGCNTRPHFGSATDRVMHCGAHKEEGHVDAKSKMCEFDGCLTVPHYVSRYVSASRTRMACHQVAVHGAPAAAVWDRGRRRGRWRCIQYIGGRSTRVERCCVRWRGRGNDQTAVHTACGQLCC